MLNSEIDKLKESERKLIHDNHALGHVVMATTTILRETAGPNGVMTERQREAQQNRNHASQHEGPKNLKPDGEDVKVNPNSQFACSVCYSNKKKIVYGCGHNEVCISCNKKIIDDDQKCPMCRKFIEVAIVLYN